ncbi:MAG: ABC-2 family transporter protein [Chlamydiales bacterium]|nr:ABC-2 family transporter protein [Chlamydiales bacterium]
MTKIDKYWAVFALHFIQGAKNSKALIGTSIFLLTCLVIFAHIWQAASHHAEIARYAPELLLWYIAFNQWILVASQDINIEIQEELQTGSLAYSMIRPISYLGMKFTQGLGRLMAQNLFLGAVSLVFTALWTGHVPFSFGEGSAMFFVGIMASILSLIAQMIIGVCCFWLQDSTPLSWVFEKLLFVCGGLLLPLSCYPEWLQTAAHYTPFPCMLGNRSALVFDCRYDLFLDVCLSLGAWMIICTGILRLLFWRGMKILNVQGG